MFISCFMILQLLRSCKSEIFVATNKLRTYKQVKINFLYETNQVNFAVRSQVVDLNLSDSLIINRFSKIFVTQTLP